MECITNFLTTTDIFKTIAFPYNNNTVEQKTFSIFSTTHKL